MFLTKTLLPVPYLLLINAGENPRYDGYDLYEYPEVLVLPRLLFRFFLPEELRYEYDYDTQHYDPSSSVLGIRVLGLEE